MSNPERNEQVVVDYYATALARNPDRALAEHFGPRYIQHNVATHAHLDLEPATRITPGGR